MKRSSVLAVAAAFILLVTVSCFVGFGYFMNSERQTSDSTFLLKHYSSLADLRRDSTLIARGTIVAVGGFDSSQNVTQFVFRITRVIVGNLSAGSTDITVLQHNGGLVYDPPMQVGDELILFMRKSARLDMSGAYVVVGGPQGRFIIRSGKVYSVGDLYPEARNTTLSIQGMDESSFMAIVEEANK
jgi:hypothetical protein